MKADNLSLLEFLGSGKRTFYIPVYQRNYDWKKPECLTLFKDIEALTADPNRVNHFLGTIVYVEGKSDATFRAFTVIDGQQRLTTIMILLKAIMENIQNSELKDDIYEGYLINPRCSENLRIKLKPMKADAIAFQKLIDDDIDDSDDSLIISNYKYFQELIKSSEYTPEQLYKGIQKLEIVYIQLDQDKENPQLIFESLNSTGMALTQADLIRNYLLMGQSYQKQEELYNQYWAKLEALLPDSLISDFVRDYLTLKTGNIPNKDKVYYFFKEYYQSLQNYDAEGFLEELTTYGEYYSWFRYCNSPGEEINKRLSSLQRLKSTVVYPFLLSVFEDCFMYKNISNTEVCQTLDVILSYVVRRLLCEMPTNALNKVFATMAKDTERYSNLPMSERVAEVLASKKGKTAFPNDNVLHEHMETRDAYKFPHIKFILEQIEQSKSKETVDFDELTIEHIMPQTLTAKWRVDLGKHSQEIYDKYIHCIGNLTLSGYNSELSNASFDEKLKVYKDSNVSITRSLTKYDHWGENEIVSRTDDLIRDIEEIWPCPDAVKEVSSGIDTRTEFDFTDEVDVTGRTPIEVEMIGDVFPVTSWRDFMKKVCSFLYEYDAQVFRNLTKHNDFNGRNMKFISDNDQNMNAPIKVAENLYIETNRSANDILNYCKLIIEKFDGVEEVSSYKLKAV